MSLFEKHCNEEIHGWLIFTKRQSKFINKISYYSLVVEWFSDYWEDKFGTEGFDTKYFKTMIVTGTILFFLWLPITLILMSTFAVSGMIFLMYNSLKRKLKGEKRERM